MTNVSTRAHKSATSPKLPATSTLQGASTPTEKPALKSVVEAALCYLTQSDSLHEGARGDDSSINGRTLVTMAIDALRALPAEAADVGNGAIVYEAIALIDGALAVDQRDAANCKERHVLTAEALDLMNGASESMHFDEAPCVALVRGLRHGAQIAATEAEPTLDQCILVLARIAESARVLRDYLDSTESGSIDPSLACAIAVQIGVLADKLSGRNTVGGATDWIVGNAYREAGKAVQA